MTVLIDSSECISSTDSSVCEGVAIVTDSGDDASITKRGRKSTTNDDSDSASLKSSGKGRSWDQMFAALIAYKEVEGHTNCPYYYEEDRGLGDWVNKQRKNPDALSPDQVEKLNSIGFDWSTTQERLWNEKFAELQAFFKQFKHSKVPKTYDESLCNWVAKQRQIHGQGRLGKERFEKLSSVKFMWRIKQHTTRVSPKEEQKWNEKYRRLVAYREKYGTTAVPFQWEQDKSLGRWVNEMRTQNTRGILRADRKSLLDKIGFLWRINRGDGSGRPTKRANGDGSGRPTKRAKKEKETPQGLTTFVADTSSAIVSSFSEDGDDKSEQSRKISRKRRSSIVSIGSDTDSVEANPLDSNPTLLDFDVMVKHLEDYKEAKGHCDVPESYKAHRLGSWLAAMRSQGRAGMLPRPQFKKLSEIGAITRGTEEIWRDHYERLRAFGLEYGHYQVSPMDDPDLANWTSSQRSLYRQDKLREDRKALLEKIDFDFDYQRPPADFIFQQVHGNSGKADVGTTPVIPSGFSLLQAAAAWVA